MRRSDVESVLLEIGVPIKNKGFRYITDAIMLLDSEAWKNVKLTALVV